MLICKCFVIGGRIDHAHHYNNAYRALDETLAMETALLAALALINPTETLIVVTSDHSHVLTMGGQATPRGHPILGKNLMLCYILNLFNIDTSKKSEIFHVC